MNFRDKYDRKPWVSHYYEVRIPVVTEPKPEPEPVGHKWHLLPVTLAEWMLWVIATPVGFWLLENAMEEHDA
jgi:hypothetical protein